MYSNFEDLNNKSRLWVYQADRPLNSEEKEFVLQNGKTFVDSWTAHNKALNASIEVRHGQFIVLAVDETKAPATGCSIDKSVHFMKAIENELKINLLDKSKVAFLKNDEVVLVNLPEVKSKVESEEISADSLTFNNMVTSKEEFETNWLIPADKSWMGRFFKTEA